jgi:hypothetical protein
MIDLNDFFIDNYDRYKIFEQLLNFDNQNDLTNINDNKEHLLNIIILIIKKIKFFSITTINDINDDLVKIINKTVLEQYLITIKNYNDLIEVYKLYEKLKNDFINATILYQYIINYKQYYIKPNFDINVSEAFPLGNNLSSLIHEIELNKDEILKFNETYSTYYNLSILENKKESVSKCHICNLEINFKDLSKNDICKCINKYTPKNIQTKRNNNQLKRIDDLFKDKWKRYHILLPEITQDALYKKHYKKNLTNDEIIKKIAHEMWPIIINNKNIPIYKQIYNLHLIEYNKYINNIN